MPKPLNVEEMIKKVGSKYVLASVVGKRAKDLNRGAKILVDDVSGKTISIAFRELEEGKLNYVIPTDEELQALENGESFVPGLPDAAPDDRPSSLLVTDEEGETVEAKETVESDDDEDEEVIATADEDDVVVDEDEDESSEEDSDHVSLESLEEEE